MSTVLIVCGGTGGHLAPGIALAETLQERGHRCRLLISQKEVDSALTRKYAHLNFEKVPGRAFSGGFGERARSIWSLLEGFREARDTLKDVEPDLVFLFGGFLSVGFALAARIAGIPIALHEANRRPGRAVLLVKRLAHRVYLPDGLRLRGLSRSQVRHRGYPVRRDVRHVLKSEAWERLGIEVPNKLLVVIGGSQGARALNEWAEANFSALAQAGVSVYCVTGLGKGEDRSIEARSVSGERIRVTFTPFTDRMGDVISAADLVVSRAGAGAIAELIRCRAPAILVPYPHAADDHQRANALAHERHGAGMMLEEAEIGRLLDEVKALIFNDWVLSQFKANMVRLDRFDAAESIASDIEALCGAKSREAGGDTAGAL